MVKEATDQFYLEPVRLEAGQITIIYRRINKRLYRKPRRGFEK